MRNPRLRLALLALLLVAFALRLYRLDDQELRGDEAFGYFFSLRTLPDIVQATLDLQEPHPVASYDLQHFWLGWAGHSEFALRFPAAWFGLLAVALLYALGHQLLRPRAVLFATLLLALSPYAIWHSQDARMYSMSLALTTASTWLMVLWLQRQRRWLAVAYLLTSLLALHTHYFTLFVLVAQNLFVLGRTVRYPRQRVTLVNWVILQFTVVFFYGPWLLRVLPILSTYGGNGDSPTFLAMFVRAFSVFVVGESTPGAQRVWWAWLAVMLVIVGGAMLWRQGDRGRRAVTLLSLYLMVPLLATWWGARTRPIFNERYLVAALPGFYLLIGAAVEEWHVRKRSGDGSQKIGHGLSRPRNALIYYSLSLLLVSYLAGTLFSLQRYYVDPAYSKTRGWRALAMTLTDWSAGLPPDQVRIAQNFPDPTLWYYYQGAVDHLVLPPQAQDLQGAQQVVHELSTAGVQRILLPRQPAANWDDNALAATALADSYLFASERQVGVWPLQLYSHPPTQWRTLGNAMGESQENTFQNGLQLRGFALSPTRLTANGLLVVNLAWQGETIVLTGSEKVFVQLLNSAGQLVAQDDRAFSYPNATIEHQTVYGILLPTALSPGAYRLIAGLYDPAAPGSPRLLTTAGADFVNLTILSAEGDK